MQKFICYLISDKKTAMFKKIILFQLFIFSLILSSFAQKKHALIIGINNYKPANAILSSSKAARNWRNLDGCVNDANAIKDMVMAKYSFAETDIQTLFNEQASREAIITQFKNLVKTAKKGDIVFIFYAGHGSQVKNSLSLETDKKDETIVPADAWKEGVADIRDKELSAFFNELLDKGVLLTVIFDSCNSGSIGRGDNFLNGPPKNRFIEAADYDAKDASQPLRPEERGALLFSAAQDFESAIEQSDENNIPHGAFTLALLKALQQLSVDASVLDIYNSLTGFMKFYGKVQEPVLAANEQRRQGTLFALPKGTLKNKMTVGMGRVESKGVELNGGYAFGLAKGNILVSLNGKDTIEITELRGANKSLAKSLNGNHRNLAPGTLFEVINWASANAPALKIYLGAALPDASLESFTKAAISLKENKNINWVTDISKSSPDKIYFVENGKLGFYDKKKGKEMLETAFSPAAFKNSMGSSGSVFVNVPASKSLEEALQKSFKNYNNIQLVSEPANSQYTLVGSLNDANELSYALVKSQVNAEDAGESLPLRTDFEKIIDGAANTAAVAERLSEQAFKIAKVRDWLMLQGPGGQNKFPYKLSFEYYSSGEKIKNNEAKLSDTLSIYFEEDSSEGGWRTNYKKRYIYVFSIDSKGGMNLLFPDINSGNIENKFPVTDNYNKADSRSFIASILITPPVGTDNYFMLSSEEAINNLSIFNQEAVITRGPESTNPLEALLFTGAKTRSEVITPITWGINKVVLKTKP